MEKSLRDDTPCVVTQAFFVCAVRPASRGAWGVAQDKTRRGICAIAGLAPRGKHELKEYAARFLCHMKRLAAWEA